MDKARLSLHLARHLRTRGRHLTRADVCELLEELQRVCTRELQTAGRSLVPGVVKLVVETRRERRGRHPITGEAIVIPARNVVTARISSRIRDAGRGAGDVEASPEIRQSAGRKWVAARPSPGSGVPKPVAGRGRTSPT